jgi:hypothetical protein
MGTVVAFLVIPLLDAALKLCAGEFHLLWCEVLWGAYVPKWGVGGGFSIGGGGKV